MPFLRTVSAPPGESWLQFARLLGGVERIRFDWPVVKPLPFGPNRVFFMRWVSLSAAMKLYLFKLVTLLSTVGMVLPAGWCCGALRQERAPAAVANAASGKSACCQRSCCQKRQPVQRSIPGRMPACPNFQCCCQRDAALPVKRVQGSHAPTLAVPVAIREVTIVSGPSLAWKALSHFPEGPSTHLLQCVWRC